MKLFLMPDGSFFPLKEGEENKLGTENLAKFVVFTAQFKDDIMNAFDDEKLKFIEAIQLYFKSREGLKETIANSIDIVQEFKDLSGDELVELSPVIAKAYNVNESRTNEIIDDFIIPIWIAIENVALIVRNAKQLKA